MSNLLHDITKSAGASKSRQRLGRGEGSKGKTSGRGQKGAGARAGKNKRIGFEGGQSEVYRRFPFRGFSNKPFETRHHAINISDLERFEAGATVDQRALKQAGLVPNLHQGVKVLGNGKLTRKLIVIAAAFSRSAHKAITDAGGQAQNASGQPYQFREPKNRRQAAKLDRRLAALGLPPRQKPEAESAEADETKPAGKDGKGGKGTKVPKKPAGPRGQSGDVTEAPESGTKESDATPRRKARPAAAAPEAPEAGQEG